MMQGATIISTLLFLLRVVLYECVICPPGWVVYRTHCYFVDLSVSLTRGDANIHCQNLHAAAYLAFLETPEEYDFVMNHLAESYDTWKIVVNMRSETPGTYHFFWKNGCPLTYDPFIDGYPNGDQITIVCVNIIAGGMRDQNCVQTAEPLCEKKGVMLRDDGSVQDFYFVATGSPPDSASTLR